MRMRPGTLVRLKESRHQMALVSRTIRGTPGGRVLDRRLAGFTHWNIEELEEVPRTSPLRRYFHD
jgi:hypothetical protein